MKRIFIESLPSKLYHGNRCIDWIGSKGLKVKFIYDNIEGTILIKDIKKGKNGTKLLLCYNENEKWYDAGHFKECKIGNLIGTYNHNYIYEVGQSFRDLNRNFIIIDRKTEKDNNGINRRYYKYHCNICEAELWKEEGSIKRGSSCACCCKSSNKSVVKGINDIFTTANWMVKYMVNKEEAYRYTNRSNKLIKTICPYCGNIKETRINNLYVNGFCCNVCGDGVSYPEKVLINVFKTTGIDFISQLNKNHFTWCGKYRYDFYFKLNGEEYIVEAHGLQHYEEGFKSCGGKTLAETQQNDRLKKKLAIDNGIKLENYIVIDCRKSELDFIKNNIIKSKLGKLFSLINIDWDYIEKESNKSILVEVCNYWKEHNNINNEKLSTTDIGKVFNISRVTALSYIKIGDKLGLCSYKKRNKIIKNNNNCIEVYKGENKIGIFNTYKEIIDYLKDEKLNYGKISNACSKNKKYKGYSFIIKNKEVIV